MESTTQIFLRIHVSGSDVIKGESRAGGYENRIQIDNFHFGMKAKDQTVRESGAEQTAGNLDFDRVTVSKFFDRSSLRLLDLLRGPDQPGAEPTQFEEARITVDQQLEEHWEGKAQNAIIVIHLYKGHVVDVKLQTSEGDKGATMKEDLTLSFKNIAIEYYFRSDPDSDYRDDYVGFETDYQLQDE